MLGKLYVNYCNFKRTDCCTVTIAETKETYRFSLLDDGSPLIVNLRTNKQWGISWQELLDLAIKADIDYPKE
jgi:hypothetical protein